jgi:hypothetical protein
MPGRLILSIRSVFLIAPFLFASVTWGQQQASQNTHDMDMSGHDMSKMKDMPDAGKDPDKDSDASAHAMHSMEEHMDMGPHMKMTALRPAKPGDSARARQIVESARKASEKYVDYRTALADGYKIFHPEIPQKMYHFTNSAYAVEAAFRFNPEHPTSLLYEKRDGGYELIGAMYTAPKRLDEEQLNERVPLSVAQWHEHVNLCSTPPDRRSEVGGPHPLFGLRGSIASQEACDAAGGTFHPVIFNWMVHVYPFEKEQANIWSVDRQHGDGD